MFTEKILEVSDDLEHSADKDLENGKTLKGFVKAIGSGAIKGVCDGLLVNGIILTAIGVVAIVNGQKSKK